VIALVAAAAVVPYVRLILPPPFRAWFADGDFVDQFYAFARFETAELSAGRLPLWNPLAYGGSPFWADVQAAVAYPLSLVFTLPSALALGRLPFLALELEAVAHIALASVATYVFARRRVGRFGAAVAACAFGLGGWANGYAPLQLAVIESGAWLPIALIGADLTIDRLRSSAPGPAVGPPVLAVGLGASILAGHPQTAMQVLLVVAAWISWRLWSVRRSSGPAGSLTAGASTRPRAPTGAAAITGAAGIFSGLLMAVGLSAAGWLPGLSFLRGSTRAAAEFEMLAHGFPPSELLGIALPSLTHWSPLYVGGLGLAWSIGAAARPRGSRAVRFWALAAAVALLLSLGRNGFGFDLAYNLGPGFDLFRGQERAAFVISFALAQLAGHGADAWLRGEIAARRAAQATTLVLVSVAAVAAAAVPADRSSVGWHALGAAGGALVVLSFRRPNSEWSTDPDDTAANANAAVTTLNLPARGTALLALAVLVPDLWAASWGVNLRPHPPESLARTEAIELLTSPGVQRVDDENRFTGNAGVQHGFESLSGASPLRLSAFERLRTGLVETGDFRWRLRELLAVSHAATWREQLDQPADLLLVDSRQAEPIAVYAIETIMPYAWRAGRAEQGVGDDAALERLRDPTFSVANTVLLSERASPPGAGPGNGRTEVVERRPGYVRVRTHGTGGAWIVFSENHAPGWSAEVDGQPATVNRANVALVAVAVGPGSHIVQLRYRPVEVTVGIGISLVAALFIAGWVTIALRMHRAERRRRWRDTDASASGPCEARPASTSALRRWKPASGPRVSRVISLVGLAVLWVFVSACSVSGRDDQPPPTYVTETPAVDQASADRSVPGGEATLTARPPADGHTGSVRSRPLHLPAALRAAPADIERWLAAVTASAPLGAPSLEPTVDRVQSCDGIVRSEGEDLVLDGQPFSFFGINVHYLVAPDFPEALTYEIVAGLAQREVNTIRVWFQPGSDPERFERLLDIGRQLGVKFVVTLGDNVFHGRDWFGSDDDRQVYRPHLYRTAERFRDRPEILMWELLNEPNCGDGGYDDDCLETIRDWIGGRADELATIDACHPISSGMIGPGNYEPEHDSFRRIHRRDSVTVVSAHRRTDESRARALEIAAEIGRPVVYGEIYYKAYDKACQPLDGGAELDRRAESVRDDLRRAVEDGVDGYLLWTFAAGTIERPNGTAAHFCGETDYEISDPVWEKLARDGELPPPVPWR